MKSMFLAIERCTTAIALWCAGAMLVIASCSGLYQIISRFIIEQPAEWTEVVVRFSLIWMVFLGVPACFRQGSMVSVDLLYRLSSPRLRRVLDVVIMIASLILMLVILWWGYDYAWRTRFQTIPGVESLTMIWAYGAMPVGALFALFAIIGQWLDPQHHELETAQ